MAWLSNADWAAIMTPSTPLLEIIVRGATVYFFIFALLRLVLKRQAGSVGMTDLLVLVLIADAAQNAMAANYRSLPDGLALAATLVGCNYLLEWLGYHIPAVKRFLHPPALTLVEKGRFVHGNMKKELITEEDLMSWLREKGVSSVSDVELASMEGNGRISVVKKDAG